MDPVLSARERAQLCAKRAGLTLDPMMRAKWWAQANAWAIVADHLEATPRIIDGERLKRLEYSAEQSSADKESIDQQDLKSTFNVIRSKRCMKRQQSKERRSAAPRLTVVTNE
jgi:hypothetical protein